MAVLTKDFYDNQSRGASILEVVLAMAIIALATPFVYNQINQSNQTIKNIAIAKQIISVRDNALNFVRMNQDKWPDTAQIRLTAEELQMISPDAVAGFIDKYVLTGATTTDVYLAFDLDSSDLQINKIASHIGTDSAVVGGDGVAYSDMWAVAAPDFAPGDLIYRISRDIVGEDTSKYLHRATSGEDNLNVMMRDLDMAQYNIYNVSALDAKSADIRNGNAAFVKSPIVSANEVYFSGGANVDGQNIELGNLRVSGDVSGFRNIYAQNVNGNQYTTVGRIITDRANIYEKINVSQNLTLKSESSRTISGFTGVSVNTVLTSYLSTEEIIFYENFGLTISGELLMSSIQPLKIGNWVFPSTRPPEFSKFNLTRAQKPDAPNQTAFQEILRADWQQQAMIQRAYK
ncbi:MAG: hypothetical protein IJN91_02680 [Alphaproteobacteria bacterium]|nr:hypothetical protein [Alphaproteobacteria bacterium]